MNIQFSQSQFELFPNSVGGTERTAKPAFLFSSLTLSLENLIVVSIFFVMMVILSFTLGVERGKHVEAASPQTSPLLSAAKDLVFKKQAALPAVKTISDSENSQSAAIEEARIIKPTEILKNGYTIQVASFKKDEYAKKEAQLLIKKGYNIFIVPKGGYSILCVGKFPQKERAQSLLGELKLKYKDSIVRRL